MSVATVAMALACVCALGSCRSLKEDVSPLGFIAGPIKLQPDSGVVDKRNYVGPKVPQPQHTLLQLDLYMWALMTQRQRQQLPSKLCPRMLPRSR